MQGFYKKDELERVIQRRGTRASLGMAEINEAIVERFYQQRAIRRIGENDAVSEYPSREREVAAREEWDLIVMLCHDDRSTTKPAAKQ